MKDHTIISSYADRQEIVGEVAGFYAPSKRELSESLTVISSRVTGVNQHLHEIQRHQQSLGAKNPQSAVIAVTREYIANYRSAVTLSKQLGSLALWVADIPNPKISLMDEISSISSEHRAFVRFLDLKNVYSKIPTSDDAISQVLDYSYFSKNLETEKYLTARLGQITINMARKSVENSFKDQQNRAIFWLDTLGRIKNHRVAGPIISGAINLKTK